MRREVKIHQPKNPYVYILGNTQKSVSFLIKIKTGRIEEFKNITNWTNYKLLLFIY